ncbi:MAG: OmpA family protein [Archangium sp.]|nr:OmpA family protein [Archangium sp.]
MKRSPLSISLKAAAAAALLMAPLAHAGDEHPPGQPLPTQPGDFSLRIESGVVIPLTTPQSQLFAIGGGQTIKAAWALNRYLDLGPSVTFMALPSKDTLSNPGTAWTFGASLRLKRPHDLPDDAAALNISPWIDVDALYVRTGPLNRPGFAAAVGASIPLGKKRVFWIGPFARYTHIIQLDRPGYDNHDGKLLTIGLSLEVGSGVERAHEVVAAAPAEIRTVNTVTVSCPDSDGDTIPDTIDRCPDVAGPMDSFGCPPKPRTDAAPLELDQKAYFAFDESRLQPETRATLDGVIVSLKEHQSSTVQVEGHASSEGRDHHNQVLSNDRAEAVRDYLVAHGIAKSRIVWKGFSSSVPRDTNETESGRENNRRVEFVVNSNTVAGGSR